MIAAKLLLVFLLLLILIFYLVRVRSKIWDRIIFTIMLLTGVVFVLYPGLTTRIAHSIGIGRGADLIFYLAIVFFSFCLILLYSKYKELEMKFTELVRKNAVDNANEPDSKN